MIEGQQVRKEPKDASNRAKRKETDGQSCLISEFLSMETKEKKEQISKQSKKGQKNGTIEREKGKGKKIVPQKLQRLRNSS